MDKIDIILERIDSFEKNTKEQFAQCQKFCFSKIENVKESTDKAHERLNEQKNSIECLFKFKNRQIGALIVIGIILSILGYNII